MLSPLVARQLRERGHDAEALSGTADEALPDADVLTLARSQRWALVTNNLVDFRPLHHAAIVPGGPGHCGMVFMPGSYRRTKADVGRIVEALEETLKQFSAEPD